MRISKAFFATLIFFFVFCTIPRDNPFDPKNPDYIELNGPDSVFAEALSWTSVRLSWEDKNTLENGYAVERKRILSICSSTPSRASVSAPCSRTTEISRPDSLTSSPLT